jgi:hypothetical protein
MTGVPSRPVSIRQLQLALEVIAYELERRPDDYRFGDPITALEQVRVAAASLPPAGAPLRESYPAIVELAARALAALGSMPEPSEVDGLLEFGGFDLWRRQR